MNLVDSPYQGESMPLHEVIADHWRRRRGRYIPAEVCEFLVDTLQRHCGVFEGVERWFGGLAGGHADSAAMRAVY